MKRKTIAAINCNVRSGGGKVMLGIAEVARNSGFDYYTYSPESKIDSPKNHSYIISRYTNYANMKISQLIGYDSAVINYGTYKLINQLKKIRPDLIHLHGLHGWYIDYKKLFEYIKQNNIPVVWTQHDCWAFTGKCTHFSYVKCNKWKTGCYDCPQLSRYPESKFIDNSKPMYNYKKNTFTSLKKCQIVSVSNWLMSILEESFLKNYPITTIENGIDVSVFKFIKSDLRNKYGLNDKVIILGVAASWNERKGLDDFINLRGMLPEDKFEIIIIGLNSQQLDRVKKEGIIGISRTANKSELAEWYSTCDVFFNPSIEETFGLVTVEAMACGAPVIVYNSTAAPELIKHTNNYCVNTNDLDEVVECINKILKNGKLFYSNVERAYHYYNQDSQYEKYLDLYSEFLD